MRVIYTPKSTHPWSHFSATSTAMTIDFFEESIGAPTKIDSSNQIWRWKAVFNAIGIVGFFMFVVSFTKLMLALPAFASLQATSEIKPAIVTSKKRKVYFWLSLALNAAFGLFAFIPVMQLLQATTFTPTIFGQRGLLGVSVWAACCGVFSLLCMLVFNRLLKNDPDFVLADSGIKISGKNLLKTIALAIIVVFFSFGWVFLAHYFFHTDFRLWVLAIRVFNPVIIKITLPFILIICIFYLTSSVATNCFNYRLIAGKEWVNTLVLAVFSCLPIVILVAVQYGYLFATGYVPFPDDSSGIILLFPLIALLPISIVISRKIYKATKNPYLPAIVNTITIALISSATTNTFL